MAFIERHSGLGTASWKVQQEDNPVSASTDVMVRASGDQTHKWANRPRAKWPLSMLAGHEVLVWFDCNGLVDLYISHDTDDDSDSQVTGAELSAWASDVLREVGFPEDHPSWHVTVGQFEYV